MTRSTGFFGQIAGMPIAAGNLFIGSFDVNNAMSNPLKATKFGLPFRHVPTYLAGYYKLGDSDMQAIGASLRYFSLGEVQESRDGGMGNQLILNPYEMAFDVSYSRKLSDVFSMAVALRYIRSDMGASSDADMVPDNAFAADIAGYLEKYVILGNSECLWSFGFNVSNIGTKVSYDGGNTNQFLPTMLKVGTGLLYPIDDYNQIGIYVDLSKYLVPTEPIQEGTTPEDEAAYKEKHDEYNNMSPITGIFKSFGDSVWSIITISSSLFVAVITMKINIRETVSISRSVPVSA